MFDRLEFYHGAAIIQVIQDSRCHAIEKIDSGYLINGERPVAIKYTTKEHSPWRFTVNDDDITRFDTALAHYGDLILALVCGGDGVCALSWRSDRAVLGGLPGWLAVKRSFNGCYAVSGSQGELARKVAINRWPDLLFEVTKGNIE